MELFSDLCLLADVSEIVRARPHRLTSPLEAEMHMLGARLRKRKRSSAGEEEKDLRIRGKQPKNSASCSVSKKKSVKTDKKCYVPLCSVVYKRELPVGVDARIRELGGSDVKLVLEKAITASDMNGGLGRFSLPLLQFITEFLDPGEKQSLTEGVIFRVPVIDPSLHVSALSLKQWKFSTKPIYVLTTEWRDISEKEEEKNGLKPGHMMQVWTFRTIGRIGFAVVKAAVAEAGEAASGSGEAGEAASGSGSSQSSPSSVLTRVA